LTIEVAVKMGISSMRNAEQDTEDHRRHPVHPRDRYKVVSIGTKKIKETKSTTWESISLLWPEVPRRRRIRAKRACMSDDTIYGG
jgi:hypothetical protein